MADPISFANNQQVNLNLQTLDAAGNVSGTPTAPVTWTGSNDAVATVIPGGDTLSALVPAVTDATGDVTVTATDGAGLSDSITITVTAAVVVEPPPPPPPPPPVQLQIVPDAPTDKA